MADDESVETPTFNIPKKVIRESIALGSSGKSEESKKESKSDESD